MESSDIVITTLERVSSNIEGLRKDVVDIKLDVARLDGYSKWVQALDKKIDETRDEMSDVRTQQAVIKAEAQTRAAFVAGGIALIPVIAQVIFYFASK